MGRYELPDPKCHHKPKGYVLAGSFEGAHYSHTVCDREECISDALEWAHASNLKPIVHRRYKQAGLVDD